MSLPNLSGTARLYADVDLRFSPNGMAVAKIPLVFNSRKKDDAGNWVDADSFFVTGALFKDRAEWAAEKLNRGDEVVVTGRLKTRSWEQDGQKRSIVELMLDEVGPTLRTLMPKAQRSGGRSDTYGGQGRGGQQSAPPAGDPWVTGTTGPTDDSPPF